MFIGKMSYRFRQLQLGVASGVGVSAVGVYYYLNTRKRNVLADSYAQDESFLIRAAREGNQIKSSCSCHFNKQLTNVTYNEKFQQQVPKLFRILVEAKEEFSCPGISFGILKNGELVMKGGVGFSDVENEVLCSEESVFRIASISKSLTSVAVGKLIEKGLLDIDKPIETYVKDFPTKKFNDKPVVITTRNLLSHTSGIRGYFDGDDYEEDEASDKAKRKRAIEVSKYGDPPKNSDENFITEHYDSVKDGLKLFVNDALIYAPDTDYEYSSVAYSLVSRIIENISGQDFITYMSKTCDGLGLKETVVDLNNPLVYGRTRNYDRNKRHQLENTRYVDNSYKWSGGGFLSSINDLLTFGDNMINSLNSNTGYLQPNIIHQLWQVNPVTIGKYSKKYPELGYALGWSIKAKDEKLPYIAFHTGGAVGASSIFMIVPSNHPVGESLPKSNLQNDDVVIALIVNMQSVGLYKTACKLLHVLNEE